MIIFRNVLIRSASILLVCLIALGAVRTAPAQATCSGKDALTSKSCAGDANSAEEQALFDLVAKYRTANGLPAVRLSPALSMVANRHIIDLLQNVKAFTHGWSNCPYDFNVEKTWPCVSDSPKRLNSGYTGQAFETLYRTTAGQATPALAMDAWKKSKLHNSIILNLDVFKDLPWNEVGVAVEGGYAALWFGFPGGVATPAKGNGLGVSYDQAVAGLSKLLSIDQASSSAGNNKWLGVSADKKTTLEILGSPKDITQATVGISMKLGADGNLTADNHKLLVTLLGNLFPEWPNIDAWLSNSVAAISADRSASRTKLVRKIAIDLRSDAANSLKLLIKPESKEKYMEF